MKEVPIILMGTSFCCLRVNVFTGLLSLLPTTSAAFITLQFEFDLGFEVKIFIFLWIGITGFVVVSQRSGEDVFQLIIVG